MTASPDHAPRRGVSRRAVMRTAAWTAPTVTVLAAAPAFAAYTTTLGITYNSNSFVYAPGFNTPYALGAGGAFAMTVTSSPASMVTVSLATSASVELIDNGANTYSRGSTTWTASQGAIASDGWTVTPAVSSTDRTAWSFLHPSMTTANLRFLLQTAFSASAIGSAVLPIRLTASASGAKSVTSVISYSANSPYLTGTNGS
jgi:hypothetical protein